MHRIHRLTSARDFARVMRRGTRGSAGPVSVVVLATGEERPARVGFATGRAIGSAVRRNRAKRLLREVFRRRVDTLPAGADLVAILKGPVDGRTFHDIEAQVDDALNKAGLAC